MSNYYIKLDLQKVDSIQEQLVNPWHQTPQGQSDEKPGTLL